MNHKNKVLIIDDDQDLLEMYGHKFASEGFEVEKAGNGAWGLKRIREGNFDIVLLDMAMPALNGVELLKTIQGEREKLGNLKIIVLSNTALDNEIREMKSYGADRCFVKIKITPGEICAEALKLLNDNGTKK